jgi:hypothetical protein
MTDDDEDRRRLFRKGRDRMFRAFYTSAILGCGSMLVILFIIGGLSVAVGTAIGSGFLLIGAGGQAFNEMARFREVRSSLFPEGYMHGVRLQLLSSYAPFRATRKKYRQAFLEMRDSGRAMRRKLSESEQQRLALAMFEAMTKARNWIIILGGSAILLAASIRACIGLRA